MESRKDDATVFSQKFRHMNVLLTTKEERYCQVSIDGKNCHPQFVLQKFRQINVLLKNVIVN